MHKIYEYLCSIALILELVGAHPRIDVDQDWATMLRRAGWRPFIVEKVI